MGNCTRTTKVGYYTGNDATNHNIDCGFQYGTKFIFLKRLDSTQTSGNGRWVFLSNLSDGQQDSNFRIRNQSQNNSAGHYTSYNGDVGWNQLVFRDHANGFTLRSSADHFNTNNCKVIFYAVAKLQGE